MLPGSRTTPAIPHALDTAANRRHRLKHRVRHLRRALRSRLSIWLARLHGTTEPRQGALADPPRSILVCRANKRLGNVLFVTPLIRALANSFPGSSIDVLVVDPAHRCLLAMLPGVRDVIRLPRNPAGIPAFLSRLRARPYDLAIDPSVNATTNRLIIALCRAENKLGFAGPEQWVRLTHAAGIPTDERHQARQALRLLQEGVPGAGRSAAEFLCIRPGEETVRAAAGLLREALGGPRRGPIVGFFTRASGDKQLSDKWWQRWVARMQRAEAAPVLLQLLPPDAPQRELPGTAAVCVARLDRLGALMGLLDVFVSADSGPMHLAAAAGTPTIGLFRATSPKDYAPLGPGCLALESHQLDPSEVARYTLAKVRFATTAREATARP